MTFWFHVLVSFCLISASWFCSGEYPGVVLQDPQQPLLSWNDQQHLHGRVQRNPHLVALLLQFLSFFGAYNYYCFMTGLKDPNSRHQNNPFYWSVLKTQKISQTLVQRVLRETTKQGITRLQNSPKNLYFLMKYISCRTGTGEGSSMHTHIHTHRR